MTPLPKKVLISCCQLASFHLDRFVLPIYIYIIIITTIIIVIMIKNIYILIQYCIILHHCVELSKSTFPHTFHIPQGSTSYQRSDPKNSHPIQRVVQPPEDALYVFGGYGGSGAWLRAGAVSVHWTVIQSMTISLPYCYWIFFSNLHI